jgi:glycosyltransferase involved in cell wall biosynthesis
LNSICFFGVDSGSVLAGTGPVSGEDLQHVLLARAFRDLGLAVTLIDFGNPKAPADRVIDGIRVLRACDWSSGLPVVRFAHPRLTGAVRALHEADADVYYQSPAGLFTGVTAAFCRRRKRRFIFRVASDANCVPGAQLIELWRDRKIFEFGLRRADLVAVQTVRQKSLLETNYRVDSEVVEMAVQLPERCEAERDIDVVWVGNLRPVKRPELALSVAAQLPERRFVMIGGPLPGTAAYYERIAAAAACVPNVRFLGALPHDEVNAYIARAKVLLNTSTVEGFPNTFLQAWARAVPVVSLFDPDGIIARRELGASVCSPDELRTALESFLEDDDRRERVGRAAREYTAMRFSPTASAQRYLELL